MMQAYATDRAPSEDILREARRHALRTRFQQLIVLPVSLATITAFAVLATRDLAVVLRAPAWIGDNLPTVALIVAAATFVLSLAGRLRT